MKVDNFLSMLMPLSRGSVDEAANQIPSHAERDLSRAWFLHEVKELWKLSGMLLSRF